jgi:DNA gyrase subunit A
MATKRGIIKKTELTAYGNPRQSGIIALTLDAGDELIRVGVTSGEQDIFLATRKGLSIRFAETDVRTIGRTGRGVIGIRMDEDDEVIGMEILAPDACILTVTEGGYGKRTHESEYRQQARGGKGLINLKVTPKTGEVVGIRQVLEGDDVMVMSDSGNLVRVQVSEVSQIGRNTQGVRMITLAEDQRVVGLVRIEDENGKENGHEDGETGEIEDVGESE